MAGKRTDVVTNILALLMLLEIIAGAGMAGYFIFTGTVTADQARLAWQVYEKKITDQTQADAEAWQKHQADEQLKKEQEASGADATAKLAVTAVRAEAARLGLEGQLKRLQDRENLLNMKFDEFKRKQEHLKEIEKRIDRKTADLETTGSNESFQKMAAIMKAMKPKALKDILIQMDEVTVVEVLKALGTRQAAKVLAEFSTPGEVEQKRRYLDRIRQGDLATTTTPSGG